MSHVVQLGYRSIMWSLDSGDWRTDATATGVAQRVLSRTGPGEIVVLHLASTATAAALPTILDGLHARGLQVVTVSAVLGESFQAPTPPATRPIQWIGAGRWLAR